MQQKYIQRTSIIRVKYGFMRVTIQIFYAALETLEPGRVGDTFWVPRIQVLWQI